MKININTKRPQSKQILIWGIVAIVLAIAQFFVVELVRWLTVQGYVSGFNSEAMFGLAWMMVPMFSIIYSIGAIIVYIFKSSRDTIASIGLYVACLAIPIDIVLFVINTSRGIM